MTTKWQICADGSGRMFVISVAGWNDLVADGLLPSDWSKASANEYETKEAALAAIEPQK